MEAPERIWRHYYQRTINPVIVCSEKKDGLHSDSVTEYIRADIHQDTIRGLVEALGAVLGGYIEPLRGKNSNIVGYTIRIGVKTFNSLQAAVKEAKA